MSIPREFSSSKESPEAYKGFKLTKSFSIEAAIVVLLLIVFLVINIAISSRLFPVWQDEVLLTDPAANLYLGNGFTSSAWYYQTKDEFWACNAPLHAILLYHWMRLFGFSLVAVRSLSYAFMAVSVLIIWLAVLRLNLVTSIWSRIILIALLLLGEGVTFNYLSGRYDCLGISLFAAALLAYSIQSIWLRCVLLVCIGIFVPIAGIHLVPYAAILGGLLLIYLGRSFLREAASVAIGSTIGIIFLYILYAANGVADVFFVKSLGGHTFYGAVNRSEAPIKGSEVEKVIYVLTHFPIILVNRLANLPHWFFQDTSLLLLLILALVIAIYQISQANFNRHSLLSFGLVASFSTILGLGILRDYPNYYTWMSYIPLAICTCSSIDEFRKTNRSALTRLLTLVSLVLICLPGYPLTLLSGIHNWSGRDYSGVESFIKTNIRDTDKVYSDFGSYYAIKKIAKSVVFPSYMDAITPQEKADLSVIILDKYQKYYRLTFEEVVNKLGGEWYDTGHSFNSPLYSLRIFRKKM